MHKGKLLISTATTTSDTKCVVCKKELGEQFACYTINKLQFVSIPLCADCLLKASILLRKANASEDQKISTQEDHLRTCSTEELAETIADIAYAGSCRGKESSLCNKKYALEWLKEPYHNELK